MKCFIRAHCGANRVAPLTEAGSWDLWATVICVQSVNERIYQRLCWGFRSIFARAHLAFVAPFLSVVVKIAPTEAKTLSRLETIENETNHLGFETKTRLK